MKIDITINGRRHAFDLAEQLNKHDCLSRLITSYPTFKVKEWNIEKAHIKSLLPLEVFKRYVVQKTPFAKEKLHVLQKNLFDSWASKCLTASSDIFVGWSGNSLQSLRRAKSMDKITIIVRGSSHMLYQQQLLQEEYALADIKYIPAPRAIVEQELQEYREADYISIPSSFVRRSFVEYGISESKLIQVPYGVDLSHFKQIKKQDNVFRVIFAGGFSLQKGSHYLLQAICELDLPDFEFWHLGNVSKEIEPFIKKYSSDKIILKGPKPQNELYKYYSQGSVFVMPSIQEGLAMVQPQAMACGLPLICTTNTGGEDLIDEGKEGFVVPIRDVAALKEKILYLYENPEICREMGQAAKEKVSEGFTWNEYGQKMIEEYKKILNAQKN
ncbi:hypothetical protein AKJ60_00085 [candidate division MSBL1 archaeon SCGC-AAA385M11]|nr:hypothetical protein AKJ60_00085 [candidate division MSBL1 archaeon SCGC-AAA385M11]